LLIRVLLIGGITKLRGSRIATS
jgi:hypothetical protein